MKKILLFLLLLSVPLAGENITYSTSAYINMPVLRSDLISVTDPTGNVIMRIDIDGNIFLRERWIGHDERLKKIFKDIY